MFRLLVHSVIDCALYMLGPDGEVVNWNIGAERLKGYSAAEIVGQNFSRFYAEADQATGLPRRALSTALTVGRFEGEGWRIRKDGSRFWASVMIAPMWDEQRRHVGFAKITRDQTSRREAQEQERIFRLLVQGVTDYAIYLLNPDGTVANWNAGAERAKGYTATEIVGQHFSRFYTEEDRSQGLPQRALAQALAKGQFEGEGWRVRKDGTRFWAAVVIDAIYDEVGQLIGFAKITRDRSEHKRKTDELRATKDSLDLALGHMSQGLILFDGQEKVAVVNDQMRTMLGLPMSRLKPGTGLADILNGIAGELSPSGETAQASGGDLLAQFRARHGGGRAARSELKWRGRTYALNHSAKTADGGWVTTMEDVTERRVIEDRITHLAHHDPLTSLPNRPSFHHQLTSSIKAGAENNVAVLYIDLDRFKPVNDTFGHAIGDSVLKVVSQRMQAQLRRHDVVARLGGDEFAILLADDTTVQDARALATRLVRELGRTITIDEVRISIGASIGIAMTDGEDITPDVLMRNADLALYRVKEGGRGHFRFYEPGMEMVMQQRRDLEHDLRQALVNGEFALHYQPVVRREDRCISGVEALLRWKSPTRGNVSPADFIPFAEEIGLMAQIGDWVLRTACREALNWPDHIVVSVNLSPTQFASPNLVQSIEEILEDVGFPSHRLELEITETAMIGDVPAASATLKRIRALGILVALDDFGTGYSSLSFLRAMPFTRIKIDRSFVQDLDTKADALAIIHAVVRMGLGIGVSITAEGVETEAQAQVLSNIGCETLQGFLFSRPLSSVLFTEWVKTHDAGKTVHLDTATPG